MAKRLKSPPAGDKADKPGSRALQQLLVCFSHDATPIHGQNATMGQKGAKLAQDALEHLVANDAEHAVWWTVQAMLHYCTMEKHHLLREHGDDMQDLAAWWKRNTEPAVQREINRRINQLEANRTPAKTLNKAFRLFDKHHKAHPQWSMKAVANEAAKEMRREDQTIARYFYRTIIRNLPSDRPRWTR
jgi:hypothetical protein